MTHGLSEAMYFQREMSLGMQKLGLCRHVRDFTH